MGWYNASWTYRQKITVDNTKVSAALSNFPVYLDLSEMSSGFFTHVESDGKDIRITTDDGETEVPREVVSITTGSSIGEVHFKVSSLASGTDTEFYIYYGNNGASEPAADATYGAENVWNSNYDAVFHMSENPGGTAPQLLDSTSNDNDLTSVGTMTSGDLVTGALGANSAIEFDGTDDYLHKVTPSFDYTTEDFTVQVLVKSTAAGWIGTSNAQIINHGAYKNARWDSNPKSDVLKYEISQSGARQLVQLSDTITKEAWTHTAFTRNSTVGKLYMNGSEGSYAAHPSIINPASASSYDLNLMASQGGSTITPGFIDEVRISKTELLSGWISTEYNNQNSPSTFYDIGAEEEDEGGDSDIDISDSQSITENIITALSESNIDISDTITLTEDIQLAIIDSIREIDIYDEINISDVITILNELSTINISDLQNIVESITMNTSLADINPTSINKKTVKIWQ